MVAIVFLAGGLSLRYKSLKQFAMIKDKYLIQLIFDQVVKVKSVSKIILIVNTYTYDIFKQKLGCKYKHLEIQYIIQKFNKNIRIKPWGTADAVACLNVNEPVIICNSDEIYDTSLYETCIEHINNSKDVGMITYKLSTMMPEEGKVNRGIVKVKDNIVLGIEEKLCISKPLKQYNLTGDEMCNVNFFVFYPEHINLIKNEVKYFKEKFITDRKVECLLPCVMNDLIKEGLKIYAYQTNTIYKGITNPGDEKFI